MSETEIKNWGVKAVDFEGGFTPIGIFIEFDSIVSCREFLIAYKKSTLLMPPFAIIGGIPLGITPKIIAISVNDILIADMNNSSYRWGFDRERPPKRKFVVLG